MAWPKNNNCWNPLFVPARHRRLLLVGRDPKVDENLVSGSRQSRNSEQIRAAGQQHHEVTRTKMLRYLGTKISMYYTISTTVLNTTLVGTKCTK